MCQCDTMIQLLHIYLHMPHKIFDLQLNSTNYVPALSIDCVIISFHKNSIRVLMIRNADLNEWALPGGFVLQSENLEEAAQRILKRRTGLDDVFLRQFSVFGDATRGNENQGRELFESGIIQETDIAWFNQRFISIGFMALVQHEDILSKINSDAQIEWKDIHELSNCYLDHCDIVKGASNYLKSHIYNEEWVKHLLPTKFTMPELYEVYTSVLNEEIDRRNFQRKMNNSGMLIQLDERRTGNPHKSPYLYSFKS